MCEIDQIQPYFFPSCEFLIRKSSKSVVKIHQKDDKFNSSKAAVPNCHPSYQENKTLQNYSQSEVTEAKMSSNRISSHLEGSVLGSAVKNIHKHYYGYQTYSEHFKNKGTQTDYRESDCQTIPWEPPYKIVSGHPEVLTLTQFTWDNGLPAGMHEIAIINRMRMKRAWEQILPPMDTPLNIKARAEILSALEANEWAFREAEIQFIMNLRMDLAEELMQSKDNEKKIKLEYRFKKLHERICKRKQHEIKNIRNKFSRELRKLTNRHGSIQTRYNKRKIIKFNADRDSNLYDLKPNYECSKIMKNNLSNDECYHENENQITLPRWLFSSKQPHYRASNPSAEICSKKAKRDEKKLFKICEDLKAMKANLELADASNLLKKMETPPELPSTPRRSPEHIENVVDQSSKLIQNLVKGRAIQCTILEGRNRYKELIEELQFARALDKQSKEFDKNSHAIYQQEQEYKLLQQARANEILESLEGKTTSKILIFLNEELTRLQSERKAHALSLLAERERMKREIAQASKEQLEVNRRRELDEMFRQILKINQESVETYLENIVKDGVEWISKQEAEKYIIDLANKTDAMAKFMEKNSNKIDEEGMVSDMIYNFVLPEVEKESVRKRLRHNQSSYLCAAHSSIYNEILNLRRDELLPDDTISQSINSALEKCLSYESENDEEYTENDISESLSDENAVKHIINLILDYAAVDEQYKDDFKNILQQMLWNAK